MSKEDDSTEYVSHFLWITLAPAIFISGCVGNSLILVVLRRGTVSTTTANFYVSLIAAADLVVIATGLLNEWLKVSFMQNSFFRSKENLRGLPGQCQKVSYDTSVVIACCLQTFFSWSKTQRNKLLKIWRSFENQTWKCDLPIIADATQTYIKASIFFCNSKARS